MYFTVVFHDCRWNRSGQVFSCSIHLDSFAWMLESPHVGTFTVTIFIIGYLHIPPSKIHPLYGITLQCIDEIFVRWEHAAFL